MRGSALINLIPTSKEGLVENGEVKDSLGSSDPEIVELGNQGEGRKVKSKLTILYLRREDFILEESSETPVG